MFDIYIISFNLFWEQLTPPILRQVLQLAWGKVLLKPLQYLHDLIFTDYASGGTAVEWDVLDPYVVGDRVYYIDRAVYECIANTTGDLPTDIDFWIKVLDNYIGIRERIMYNSQKIVFEYGINRWFMCAGIYVDNAAVGYAGFVMGGSGEYSSTMYNSSVYSDAFLFNNYTALSVNHFTINVPVAVYTALAGNNTDRDNIIKSFADKYVMAGITYNIVSY